MDAKHTATPWRTATGGRAMQSYSQPYGIAGTGDNIVQLVAGCFGDVRGGDEQAKANAEFIVRACNSFQDLTESLQEMVDYLSDQSMPITGPHAALERAKNVLAKAGI